MGGGESTTVYIKESVVNSVLLYGWADLEIRGPEKI